MKSLALCFGRGQVSFRPLLIVATAFCFATLPGCVRQATSTAPSLEVVLTGLDNPRGVMIDSSMELYVAEAGTGYDAVDVAKRTGKLTRFMDLNGDGDFEDPDEAEILFNYLPTYNALHVFATGRDEVSGPGDILLHRDGRAFLAVDGGFEDLALYEISPGGSMGRNLVGRSNMNGMTFDLEQEHIYAVESTLNRLIEVSLDGPVREIVDFPPLDSDQQAVPAGLALDPRTGDVLVALFSGAAVDDESGEVIPFVPGDAKIVRVDLDSGEVTGEITGLTTAVDVAVDEAGNILVVEMASAYADLLPRMFDLFDRDAPPLHGGYQRFSGRVTLYPAGDGPARVIADNLDMPTNITLGPDGALYVSIGQGTPGRPIPGPDGPTTIVGQVIRITDFLSEGGE